MGRNEKPAACDRTPAGDKTSEEQPSCEGTKKGRHPFDLVSVNSE